MHQRVWERYIYDFQHDYPSLCSFHMPVGGRGQSKRGDVWWKGDHTWGTIGQANELQLLVNQEAQATTGSFRTTKLSALSMESGLRAATGLRLLSLPGMGDRWRLDIKRPASCSWAIPPLEEELIHPPVLVVPVPE